jgi:hypothetical protein
LVNEAVQNWNGRYGDDEMRLLELSEIKKINELN